jgi:hypothetical protein
LGFRKDPDIGQNNPPDRRPETLKRILVSRKELIGNVSGLFDTAELLRDLGELKAPSGVMLIRSATLSPKPQI